MHSITKEYRTETGHRLHPYDGKCSHFHGHSYLWKVTAAAPAIDDAGMVMDFGVLKHAMVETLEPLDHCFVFNHEDPFIAEHGVLGAMDLMVATNGEAPRIWIAPFNPTAENFAGWAGAQINTLLAAQARIQVIRVDVWETATSYATWEKGYAY